MAPVVKALKASPHLEARVCVTGQHRGMLDQVLRVIDVVPDFDLDVMRNEQSLPGVCSRVLVALDEVLAEVRPLLVLVHGDTTTTLAASLAAYYRQVAVGHVEAGLRTGDIYAPWPEEANRRMTAVIAALHFAPTQAARENLIREGVQPDHIAITGNTVIDALQMTVDQIRRDDELGLALRREFKFIDPHKRTILVTGHRRESFGEGLRQLCTAIRQIAARNDTQVVYPVHLNPNVAEPVHDMLGSVPGVHLLPPLDYLRFVYLMNEAHLIITDSGGVQEEAPALGKPVLVTRKVTERPEAIEQGAARLVGTDAKSIVDAVAELIDDEDAYQAMVTSGSPYGDGRASQRIVELIEAEYCAGRLGERSRGHEWRP